MSAMTTLARIFAATFAAVALVLGSALPSLADAPVTWAEEEGRSVLENIIFFGGWTVGLYIAVLIWGVLTSRHNYVPPAPENLPAHSSESPAEQH